MYFFKRILDSRGRAPGLSFVKFKKNEIGVSFSFWEMNGDELHNFNVVKVRKGGRRSVKGVRKGGLKVRKGT